MPRQMAIRITEYHLHYQQNFDVLILAHTELYSISCFAGPQWKNPGQISKTACENDAKCVQ